MALAIHMFIFLLNSVFNSLTIFIGLFVFLFWSCKSALHILNTNPLYMYYKNFLPVLGLHLYFITNVFWKTVALILINSNASAFIFHLWLFIFYFFVFCKKSLPTAKLWRFSFIFCLKSCIIVLCLVIWPIFVTFPL